MLTFASFDRVWFLTWTTYGTWLPGDARGFVSPKFESDVPEKRNREPGTPVDAGRAELHRLAQAKLVGDPILLTLEQACMTFTQFEETARFRGWTLLACAIMANHVHLVVGVQGDPDPAALMRDFKSYASRSLNRQFRKPTSGTWWTEQGSKRKVREAVHFRNVIRYTRRQANSLVVWTHPELEENPTRERGA